MSFASIPDILDDIRAGNATQAQEDEDAAKALAPDMKPEHRCDKRWMFDLKFDFCQVKGE